jgi:hypothetical protein
LKTRMLIALAAAILLASPALAASAAAQGDPHIAKALELRDQALSAYGTGDYDSATKLAGKARAELALVEGISPLPATFTVRLLPGDRDCLSKIAAYPFVYGDRAKWTILFRANKGTLEHPEDADIILPGEVLVIPSLAGEKRSGAFVEKAMYPSLE